VEEERSERGGIDRGDRGREGGEREREERRGVREEKRESGGERWEREERGTCRKCLKISGNWTKTGLMWRARSYLTNIGHLAMAAPSLCQPENFPTDPRIINGEVSKNWQTETWAGIYGTFRAGTCGTRAGNGPVRC
jgi:hypothetical protein